MRIRWGRYRKTFTIAGLGLLQLAAFIVADPRTLPPWVVSAAVAVNTIGVFIVRNDQPATSRQDLAGRVGTRAVRPEDRRPFDGP
jgi:hypothetical protein